MIVWDEESWLDKRSVMNVFQNLLKIIAFNFSLTPTNQTPILNCLILTYLSSVPRSGMWFTPRSPRTDSTVSRPADDERRLFAVDVFQRCLCLSVAGRQPVSRHSQHLAGFCSGHAVQGAAVTHRQHAGSPGWAQLPPPPSPSLCLQLPVLAANKPLFWFLYHADVIMDMFQAPTLLEDPFDNMAVRAAASEAECAPEEHGECAGRSGNIL